MCARLRTPTPDELATPEQREAIRSLRGALGLSRAEFAAILGMTRTKLDFREEERTAWRIAEISDAKRKLSTHLGRLMTAASRYLAILPD